MTSAANYRNILQKKSKLGQYKPEDAAFIHREDNYDYSDCRTDPITRSIVSTVKPLFGTDNNLFENIWQNKDEPKLLGEGSCHCSSVVWCKNALEGYPDRNVHENEADYKEIYRILTTTFYDNRDRWERADSLQRGLQGVVAGGHLIASPILSTEQPKVLNQALRADRRATIILQVSHVIAIYSVPGPEYYCFDSTIGCIKATTWMAARKWLFWAAMRNAEGPFDLNGKFSFPAKWIGVRCTLRRA